MWIQRLTWLQMHISSCLCVGNCIPCLKHEFVQSWKVVSITPFQRQFQNKFFLIFLLPPNILSAKAVCLFWRCLATFEYLLLASFSPQLRQTSQIRPLSAEVNANQSVQASLLFCILYIIFCFISTLLFWHRPTFGECHTYFKRQIRKKEKVIIFF